MTMTRKLRLPAALALLALIAAGCSSASAGSGSSSSSSGSKASTTDVSQVTLHIGDQAGSGSQALLTAAGLISKLPFKVTWSDFTSGPPMLQAMAGGAVDIGSVGNAPPVFAAAGGDSLAIVGAFQANPLGSALLVPKNSPIHSIAQLKGKRIAVAQGSSADYHLLTVLNKAGLTVHDVTLDYLQPGRRPGRTGLRPRGRVGHLVPVRRAGRGPGPRPAAGQRGGLRQPVLVHGGLPRRAGRPGQGGRDPRLPQAARPGARLGRHAPGGLGRGVGQGDRAAGRPS